MATAETVRARDFAQFALVALLALTLRPRLELQRTTLMNRRCQKNEAGDWREAGPWYLTVSLRQPATTPIDAMAWPHCSDEHFDIQCQPSKLANAGSRSLGVTSSACRGPSRTSVTACASWVPSFLGATYFQPCERHRHHKKNEVGCFGRRNGKRGPLGNAFVCSAERGVCRHWCHSSFPIGQLGSDIPTC